MSIWPTESPLYGGGTLILDLGQYTPTTGEKFYIVFTGSQIRHVTSAGINWNHCNLRLECQIPSHSVPEDVQVSTYHCFRPGEEALPIGVTSIFRYGSDSAHQMAAFLAASVDVPEELNDLEFICQERFQLTPDVQANLDQRLTAAFKALQLPRCWNVMGSYRNGTEPVESLLHFSARLGLSELSSHIATLPGGQKALSVPNRDGLLPENLAARLGFVELAQLLCFYRQQGTEGTVHCSGSTPVVVSTNLNWNNRDLDYDISELERLKDNYSRVDFNDITMKGLHLTHNGVSETKNDLNSDGEDSACFDQPGAVLPIESQGRVLEDNLRRLRGIHETIQKLRQVNTKQIAEHSQKSGSGRLSNSCPLLSSPLELEPRDVQFKSESHLSMRTFHQRRTSLSSNSRSLDSSLFDAFNVKIQINDVTPSVSQECLVLPPNSPVTEEERLSTSHRSHGYGNGVNHQVSNIGGTASRRLAKKSGGKKGPVRRQSWSSLGAGVIQGSPEEKQTISRRWSLSSLDSDVEETFSDTGDSFRKVPSDLSPSPSSGINIGNYGETPVFDRADQRPLHALAVGGSEEGTLSKSGKQSASVPSMREITSVDIKENLQPQTSLGDGSGSTSKSFFATLRNIPLQKSLSTPSIAIDDVDQLQAKAKQDAASNRQSMCIMQPAGLADIKSASCDSEDVSKAVLFQPVSLAGVLRESQRHPATADSDEEKPFSKRKKRSSIFFKKKPDKHKAKEGKKTPHQFILCQGSSLNCDVCHKPFVKKQALKCENCLVIVHDSSCKDQVIDCNKFKLQTAQAKPSYLPISKDSAVPPPSVNGTFSGQNKSATYAQQSLHEKYSLPHFHGLHANSGIPSLSEAATRSSFINLGKMTSEDNEGSCDNSSNIIETNSASMESLDEGAIEISDLEDNQVLRLTDEEPETWLATVDKKMFKKLNNKEVKKQEAIYELINTEKHHCLNLQIMQKVYAQGMMKELNTSRETIERIFPCLPELLDFHMSFLTRLRERQNENSIVDHIADILEEQFHDQRAEKMKIAYGQFCSQHLESLNLYKEWAKSDRKFQNFIKKCSAKRLCKTKGIPECLLLVTQRITKYILVIEALIKAAKDNKEEQQTLTKVLNNVKRIIFQVDIQVAEKERELRLLDLYNRMDPKTAIYYRGKKFKKSDLIANNRKLKRDGALTWKSSRGKTIEVLAVMVSDFIFFLHENNQKYVFASLENKPGIVSLQKLLVRKKAGQDSRGMYLISSNPNEPEMIELFCRTLKDQKAWMEAVREAVEHCPDEDEGVPSETEEERKSDAARDARVKELMALLHDRDLNIAHMCEERMRLMADIMETVGVDAEQYENVRYSHFVQGDCGPETRDFISSAITNATRLANSLYASGTNLSRSVSSAGEHQSDNYVSPLLPKRAETFGGFDNPTKEPVISSKVPALKKKLFHLKEHAEVMSFLPSKMKINEEMELGDSLEIALRGFDSKTKSTSRPSSICGSPDKQQNRKSSVPSCSISPQNSIQSYREVGSEMLRLTTTPLLLSQGKEQLVQIVELAHHLNNISNAICHFSSTFEGLRVQLAQANEKISKLTKEKEVRDRRPLYRPEHQLEELRNLQKQLNHDRAVWQQEKAHHESDLKTNREELERLQEQLKTEQQDVTHQRELLYRKLDALQKQGIILSPSHTVLNNYIARDTETLKEEPRSANVTTDVTTIAVVSDTPQHRRTISCDLNQDSRDLYGTVPNTTVMRQDSKARASVSSASLPANSKVLPMHLSNSATNLQKRQSISTQPVKQQLPLKLSNTFGATGATFPVPCPPGGPQQVLPLKLALGSLPSNIPAFSTSEEAKASAPKRSHSAASSPSSTLTAPVHVRGGSSPALVTSYPPNNNISMSPNGGKSESNVLHQLKLTADKVKNKKNGRETNEEIFC